MSLDDRAADRKAHAQSAWLGAEERIEYAVRVLARDSGAAVLHGHHDAMRFILIGTDHQSKRPTRDRLHRFGTVYHKVDDHLLKLNPIRDDRRYRRREFELRGHLLGGQFAPQQRGDLVDEAIDV